MSNQHQHQHAFAVGFDDAKRSALRADPRVLFYKLATAQIGTPLFETYARLFMNESNTTIDIWQESDKKTYTFYTTHTDQHEIDLLLARERMRFERAIVKDAPSSRGRKSSAFV